MRNNIDALKEDIRQNYDKFPACHFAKKYNKTIGGIYTIACLLGSTRTEKLNIDELDMVKDYISGMSLENIAKKYKHNPATIRNMLTKHHVKVKTNDGSWQKLYTWDTSFFKKIDSHEKSYWLGFIYADGNIRIKDGTQGLFQIALASKDCGHVEKLRNSLKSTHKIYDDRGNCRFIISQHEIYQDLKNLEVLENKSLTLLPPSERAVPKEFISSFLLGYFDGDGSISINIENNKCRIEIISTLEFCKFFKNYLENNGVIGGAFYQEKRCGENKNIWYLRYGCGFFTDRGKANIIKIFNALYSFSPVFLERKREKFLQCINYPIDYSKKWTIEKRKAAFKRWYEKNKEAHLARQREKRKQKKK